MKRKQHVFGLMVLFMIGTLFLSACTTSATLEPTTPPTQEQPTERPTDRPTEAPVPTEETSVLDGEALLESRCTQCHNLNRVRNAQKTLTEWEQTVTRMIGKGAKLNDEEKDFLINFLAETYGP
jgi:cytochrome c5